MPKIYQKMIKKWWKMTTLFISNQKTVIKRPINLKKI